MTSKKPPPSKRGGKRVGAGRKCKYDEPVETRGINLPPSAWAIVNKLRDSLSESEWVMAQALKEDLKMSQ